MKKPAEKICAPDEHPSRVHHSKVTDHAFERAAALFRAVGDVARLRVLEQLSDGEWCVSELAQTAGVGLSTVSQQLRLLRNEHLVTRRRSGKHVFYGLADAHVADLVRSALEHALERDETTVETHHHHHGKPKKKGRSS